MGKISDERRRRRGGHAAADAQRVRGCVGGVIFSLNDFALFYVLALIVYCIVIVKVSNMRSKAICNGSYRLLANVLFYVFLTGAQVQSPVLGIKYGCSLYAYGKT